MTEFDVLVERRLAEFLDRLFSLLRIRSVSADPGYRDQVNQCAEWLAGYLKQLLGHAEVIGDFGLPLVYAHSQHEPTKPTVLFYAHYDVQPAKMADGWSADPFEPGVVDGKIIARGAADDKGPMMMVLSAIELLNELGSLPVNFKVIVEGEEEASGDAIFKFVESHRRRLGCDVLVLCDTGGFGQDQPAITYGTRGIVYKQIDMVGPNRDLHSGAFGGIVANPAQALVSLLGRLVDAGGRINVPGFYDRVRPIEPEEHEQIAALPYDEGQVARQLELKALSGESDFLPLERLGCRPDLSVNGIVSGYTGEGPKTVLPSSASAKISARIVPDQRAAEVSELLDRTILALADPGVTTMIKTMGLADPYLAPRTGPVIDAACRVIRDAFGTAPALVREGGTIPILPFFKDKLTSTILAMGFARPDSAAHGPNEYFHIDDFRRGICAICSLFGELTRHL